MRVIFLTLLLLITSAFQVTAQIDTDRVLTIGRNALYFEDYMVAIRYFNQVVAAKPYLPQPYYYRAVARLSLEDFAGAEEDASKALDINPFITDAYEVRAVARQNLGRTVEAIPDYNRVLADKPDSRNVLQNLGLAYLENADTTRADSTFARLIRTFPRYDGGYTARARLRMLQGDTIAASADIDRAIDLNANAINAYLMRAEIAERSDSTLRALADMDMAIKIKPQAPGLYINRALLRYRADDYQGAMDDFDHAVRLDPTNDVALYNRAMLRTEVHDINRAIADLDEVIRLNPRQYRALFNRANLLRETGDLHRALADINAVIEAFPDFAAAIYLRGDIRYHMGQTRAADADFHHSVALARKRVVMLPQSDVGGDSASAKPGLEEDQDAVAAKFSSLLRADDPGAVATTASISTRGNIQNTDFAVSLLPLFFPSYYPADTELKTEPDFLREVQEINDTRTLPMTLSVTTVERALSDADIHRHTVSAGKLRRLPGKPRPVDHLARALDLMTLRDYAAAIAELDSAVVADPSFTLAYLCRATARWSLAQATAADSGEADKALRRATTSMVLDDLDRVLDLSPRMAVAWYDKGCVQAADGDLQGAADSFSRAIALKEDMGEAWYNRGYVNLRLGRGRAAETDLSRAGQLGIAPSYSLLRRMNR